jgi:DNA-binding CsgD family transcriptional regulator
MVDRVSTAFEKLTPREREILRLIAAHLQSKEIARALGLSPKTVEMHVLSARRRLSGMSRRDAALAFVAWEGGAPGSDYRKQSEPLAALPDTPPSGREIKSDRNGASQPSLDVQPTGRRDWRYELSGLQWLGLVLGVTAAVAVALAAIAISIDALIMAIQRITHY